LLLFSSALLLVTELAITEPTMELTMVPMATMQHTATMQPMLHMVLMLLLDMLCIMHLQQPLTMLHL
jgi:hypothetical protein